MEAKRKDLQERIAKGEEKLVALTASDTIRGAVERNLSKLRQQLAEIEQANSQTSEKPPTKPDWKYEPVFIEVDPRPDLTQDSEQWSTLLKMSFMKNEELCGILNGIRCGGTRLKPGRTAGGTWRWVIKPDVDPTGRLAWETQEDYTETRERYLIPCISEVTELLNELAERHDPGGG